MSETLSSREVNGYHVVTSMPLREIPAPRRTGPFRRAMQAALVPETLPAVIVQKPKVTSISCVIPACNEEDTIASVLESLLGQTRPPEEIHVVVNNTEDMTLDRVQPFLGRHVRTVRGKDFFTEVHVHDMGENADKKVGALNFGWELSRGHKYMLGVDGDTTLEKHCIEYLFAEIEEDERIGGISAVYGFDRTKVKGFFAKFLVTGQKAQFAAFNMDNLIRGRQMSVLGGQCSILSMKALDEVCEKYHQRQPWVRDSEVEDSKLSLQIVDTGFLTKINPKAYANVGPMVTLAGLHAQQVKWTKGAIDLMWPGRRGNSKGQPFHPNLALRWFENVSMLTNIVTRMAFVLLLAASLSIHAFVFNPLWLIPPTIATLLNLRTVSTMRDKGMADWFYALLFLPSEVYMWIRMGHFVSSWAQFFRRVERDAWADQAQAESGGGAQWLWPLLGAVLVLVTGWYTWSNWSINTRSTTLEWGWPLLYFITVAQTFFMFKKLLRKQRGFRV